jgi:acetyl esterase/lipase
MDIPARSLPAPRHVSDAARVMLANPPQLMPPSYPQTGDIAAWRAHVAEVDAMFLAQFGAVRAALPVDIEPRLIADVPVFAACAHGVADEGKIYLDMHAGALAYMGGDLCGMMAGMTALRVGMPIVSVDYRMPPDHPYPAALDDCVAVYRALVAEYGADRVVVGGASAGGNLAAATILRARDEGLPLPAGAVLLTPEVDLLEAGDSFASNLGIDPVLTTRLMELNRLYAGATPLDHPYVSPLYGDFSQGFPRSFVQAGTRDLLLSNAVNIHRALRRAGVEAHLHVFEAMPHGGFFGAPEDEELNGEIRQFIADCW